MFGDHRRCCSRDITDLTFHMTLQDHVIKWSCEFMEGSSNSYPAKFSRHRHCGIEYIINLIFHTISQDLAIM